VNQLSEGSVDSNNRPRRYTGRGIVYPDDPDRGYLPLYLLGHLGFLLMPWLFGKQFHGVLPTVVAVAVFLPIYFRSWWLSGRQLIAPVALMALIGMLTIPYNWGANVFIIYACAFAGMMPQSRDYMIAVAVILLAFIIECRLLGLPPVVDGVTLIVAMIVAASSHADYQRRRRNAMLRLSQEEVERLARLAERERIARDLHDLLGHTLSVVALKSDLARRLCDVDPLRARNEIAEVEKVAREALAQVRGAVTGIRAAGLRTELARVRLMLVAADLNLDSDISDEPLPVAVETALAFALREACTNIVRHARAQRVSVKLEVDDIARLVITDDGRGGAVDGSASNGLRGMRERVEQLTGALSIDSKSGRGTRLQIEIPVGEQVNVDALQLRVRPG